jgi:hypothetical protein
MGRKIIGSYAMIINNEANTVPIGTIGKITGREEGFNNSNEIFYFVPIKWLHMTPEEMDDDDEACEEYLYKSEFKIINNTTFEEIINLYNQIVLDNQKKDGDNNGW